MTTPLAIQQINIGKSFVELYVPDQEYIKQHYQQQKKQNPDTPFPYWAKVWPASLAMASFFDENERYIQGKQVLEIAAGLGLPSVVAAKHAKNVYCTDYLPEAVDAIGQSIQHNQLQNMQVGLLDWNDLPSNLIDIEVLLLSDINYNPESFQVLLGVITTFLEKGCTIILSTPQRLLAKPFIEQLLPLCKHQKEYILGDVAITVMVLQF
ncbi:class I SAM-dependent methyltransferase [Parasediminibacterium sp. JCM 36343]|uniref:class I SAM-dependent methyltransferase n=1 Tax=Parasediminibacterium sp. JCM 36343 TaxID=3374279 RepID=UPI00397D73B2